MKSIYNTNWFIFIRGLFHKNGVNLTFAVAIKHMFVFHENSEQGQHIPLLIIIAVLLAWTPHVAIVKNSGVTSYRKILILLTTACHLDRRERSDKVLISYNIPHLSSG